MSDSIRETLRDRASVDRFIREFMIKLLMLNDLAPDKIDGEKESFLADLGATSIDALELIVSLEERLGIEFADNELNAGLVRTLNHFVDVACSKLGIPVPQADKPAKDADAAKEVEAASATQT